MRAPSIAAATRADPTPRPRHPRSTSIASSPTPKRPSPTWIIPMIAPSASATREPAADAADSCVRASTSTGGPVAIPSRSSATAARSSAISRASWGGTGRTWNSGTAQSSHWKIAIAMRRVKRPTGSRDDLAGERLAAALQQLLPPGVVERLRDLMRPAQLLHRHIASQPGEHDLELLLRRQRPLLPPLAQPDLLL